MILRHLDKIIIKPINKLSASTLDVAKGDFNIDIAVSGDNEIGILENNLRYMTEQIQNLLMKIQADSEILHRAELDLLQAQISPHFLYNTLETIIWQIEKKKLEESIKMISDLSTFFRLSLSDGETIIPLTDELEHVKSYLSIQKVRYSDILDYKLKISLNTDEILIPKMTLQPIVENAIYHGLKNKRKSGNIYISGYVEDSKVILSVIDDGVGMNDSIRKNVLDIMKSVEKSKSSNGFGLRNVYQRLILYFGSSTQMDIYSVEDQGTIVQITIFANVVS